MAHCKWYHVELPAIAAVRCYALAVQQFSGQLVRVAFKRQEQVFRQKHCMVGNVLLRNDILIYDLLEDYLINILVGLSTFSYAFLALNLQLACIFHTFHEQIE